MTINSDCNNNKLEVSVSSNGCEVITTPSNGATVITNGNVAIREGQIEVDSGIGLDSHHQSSSSRRSSPVDDKVDQNHVSFQTNTKSAQHRVTKKSGSTPSGGSSRTKTAIQRHQSCPTGADTSPTMTPARPPQGPVATVGLPPIDNCDTISHNQYHMMAQPHKAGKMTIPVIPPRSATTKNAKLLNGVVTSGNGTGAISHSAKPIDWKTRLNHELTMYQKMLQSQTPSSRPHSIAIGSSQPPPPLPPPSQLNPSNSFSAAKSASKAPSQPPSENDSNHSKSAHTPRQASPPKRPSSAKSAKSNESYDERRSLTKHNTLNEFSDSTLDGFFSLITDEDNVTDRTVSPSHKSSQHQNKSAQSTKTSTSQSPPLVAEYNANEANNKRSNMNGGVNDKRATQVKLVTPYERLLYAMEHDKQWQKEIMLGRRIGLYRFRGNIGTGNFSQVKVAVHSLTKEKVAIKILDKSRLDSKTQRMLAREIRTMETLHHPNLIRIFEVIETLSKHFLIMELAPGGELFQVISTKGRFNEMEAKFYFSQILSAIEHMHQHNLIHRDIKAENVFFADSYTVKVGDFGFSTRIASKEELLSTFCGSPPYAAPELFRDESYRGPYVDYWALGVLLYFMVTGTMPFRAQNIVSLKKLILDCRYDIPSYVSVECCQLIAGCLQTDPLKRYTLEQARGTRWLRNRCVTRSMPKYDLRSSFGKLLRTHSMASIDVQQQQRRNTLSEFSTAKFDLATYEHRLPQLSKNDRHSNRYSLIEQSSESSDCGGHQEQLPSKGINSSQQGVYSKHANLRKPLSATTGVILSEEEKKTFRQLMAFGIDNEVITQHLDKGSLSHIVGTFRILLHRYLQESTRAGVKSGASSGSRASTEAKNNIDSSSRGVNRTASLHVNAIDRLWAQYARKSATPDIHNHNNNPTQRNNNSKKSDTIAITSNHNAKRETIVGKTPTTTTNSHQQKVTLVVAKDGGSSINGTVNGHDNKPRSRLLKIIKSGGVGAHNFEHTSKMASKASDQMSTKSGSSNGSAKACAQAVNTTVADNKTVLRAKSPLMMSSQGANEVMTEETAVVRARSGRSPPLAADGGGSGGGGGGGRDLSAKKTNKINSTNNKPTQIGSQSKRLTRSWRTLKHLITDNNICSSTETAGPTPTPTPVPLTRSGLSNEAQTPISISTSAGTPNSTSSPSTIPSSPITPEKSNLDQGEDKHSLNSGRRSKGSSVTSSKPHVVHKTATLQIVPNSCAALLWTPHFPLNSSCNTNNNNKSSHDKIRSKLRRSQTTPNVSTCGKGGTAVNGYPTSYLYSNGGGTLGAGGINQKKYTTTNRCSIF